MEDQKKDPINIEMLKVDSSNIESIGHDEETKTLAVKFLHGGTYHYDEFQLENFEEMKKADSVGKFFHMNVRGKFDHTKA